MTEAKINTKAKAEAVALPELEEMLEAGVHFGHKTSKWDAKMAPYIYTSRNNIHIIDLEKTRDQLKEALVFLTGVVKNNGTVLFVGTKVAARDLVKEAAKECGMPYVTERWIGGTLTNFETISTRLKHFRDLEKKKATGELEKYTKKERHDFDVELSKLEREFGGIKEMTKKPEALFVVDMHKEKIAAKEAKISSVPVVGICDTNADPNMASYVIPANDDAISALKLVLGVVAKALKK